MKIRTILITLFTMLVISGCDVAKQVGGAYNMVNCKYDYSSISNLHLAGMDLSKGLSITHVPQAISILSGRASSIPMNFTLNPDVSNPNQSSAFLNGLEYILSIDNVQFTTGSLSQTLNIPAGGKNTLPLSIGIDLATLLTGDSKDAVTNITKNFLGIGDKKSNVSLQIRPTFMVGGYAVPSPVYIPVNFTFGGGK